MHIGDFSTEALANELRGRKDLVDAQGFTPPAVYRLITAIQPLPCVDGIAVRRNQKREVEAMAIRRGTGPEKGKLCSVGGKIIRNETIDECLRRQFRSDLRCEVQVLVQWERPVVALQCAPTDEVGHNSGFGPEYGKHTISLYYPVRLLSEPAFASTSHGGQEATAVEWYSLSNFPARSEFGYDQGPKFVACLEAAERLLT